MSLRNNAYNRLKLDPYGNSTVGVIDKNSIQPTKDLVKKGQDLNPNTFNPNQNYQQAVEQTKNLKPLEAPEFEKKDIDYGSMTTSAMQSAIPALTGPSTIANVGSSFKDYKTSGGGMTRGAWKQAGKPGMTAGTKGLGNFSRGAGAAVGAASAIGSIAGANMVANKKEDVGGALAGASTGAGLGMSLGSVIPGIGNVAGAIGGAVIGGVAGWFTGKGAKKRREAAEAKEQAARDAYNREIAEQKRISLGRAKEADNYARIVDSANRYDAQGNLRFKKGGVLRYGTISKEELQNYYKEFDLVSKHQNGNKINIKNIQKEVNQIPIFRRGGKTDILKSHVIIDGPSHDEHNNTGINGDKGLPVVMNGTKIAEIESLELVLDKPISEKVENMVRKYNTTKDEKIKKELGELLSKELQDNTYDYSDLTKD